jgi:DNA processing protein
MIVDDRARMVALALAGGIGWKLAGRLLAHFGALEAVFAASEAELRAVRGIGTQLAGRIRHCDVARTAADLERLAGRGIVCATVEDAQYPSAFNELDDRPLAVFWRGELQEGDRRAVGIVGTRQPSAESRGIAARWAAALSAQGWTIVSGLARGIDSVAHRAALHAGGRTVAVLGCGIDHVYPPENAALASAIARDGAVIAETHPDSPVAPELLVLRNRLIAALSRAVIVVEAGAESGALYAARRAHLLGRTVFALPNSAGNVEALETFARPLPGGVDVEAFVAQLQAK